MEFDFKTIRAGKVDLACVEHGRGTAVIFLHGNGPTDLRTWAAQLEPFAAHHRAIAYSRRYHFPNDWTGDGSEINSTIVHAGDLAALIEAMNLGRAHLVGLSYGADVALRMAVDHPNQVRSLTLTEPALFTWLVALPGGAALFAEFTAAMKPAVQAANDGDMATAARLWLDGIVGDGMVDRLPAATRDRVMVNIRLLAHEITDIADVVTDITRAEAAVIRVPCLLLLGEESPPMFRLVLHELARELPDARQTLIGNASHLLHAMNPRAFNAAVLSFLSDIEA